MIAFDSKASADANYEIWLKAWAPARERLNDETRTKGSEMGSPESEIENRIRGNGSDLLREMRE